MELKISKFKKNDIFEKLLRYHGTPKLTMFSKNTLLSFSDRYYSNLSFTKSFRKKDCFYAKLWTKKDLWH